MSKSDVWENELLLLLFNNDDATGIGDAGGLLGSVADGNLYASLHTADPGEAGNQDTSEADYTSYARVAVVRSAVGWTVTDNSVSPADDITFPTSTGAGTTMTYFGIGKDSTGAGDLLYSGSLSPTIAVAGTGITPIITSGSTITED